MAEYSENYGFRLDDQDDDYNVDVFNGNFELVDAALKEMESVILTATLTAAGWVGGTAPYVQTVAVPGLAVGANGTIGLAPTATLAQVEAAADAKLLLTGQAAGSITVSAFGDKPSVNLPVQILVVG